MSFDIIDDKYRNKIDDAVFAYVGLCHIDNINKEIEQTKKNIYINPNQKEMDQNIRNYINDYIRKYKKQKRRNYLIRISRIAAVFIISMIIISTILLSSVDALKKAFWNLFVEEKTNHSTITIDKNEYSKESIQILLNDERLKDCYIPSYVPDNFVIEKVMNTEKSILMLFADPDSNFLSFEQSKDIDYVYMVDTEGAHTETISVQGQEGMLIIKNNLTSVLWQNNEGVFNVNVHGQLDREEILKFCESLYLKK